MLRIVFRLFGQGIKDMALAPWAQLLTLTAVTMVCFLVGLFLMAITTLDHQLSTMRGETVFQVYWQPGTDQATISQGWSNIREMPGYYSMTPYTSTQALEEMAKRLGRGADKREFPFLTENNPLPATALLTFVPKDVEYERWYADTKKLLQDLQMVQRVSGSPLRDDLGASWRKINNIVMRPAIIFLVVLMGLVVGNTVRLSLIAKASEVEILRMVGARNWYIRLPLLFMGAVQGLLGAGLALSILGFMHLKLHNVLNIQPFFMEIQFLPHDVILFMLTMPALTGLMGGWIGLRR